MSDLPPDAADQPSPVPLSPGGSRRAIAIVVGSLLVAIIGGLFAWQALSDSDDGGDDEDKTNEEDQEDFDSESSDDNNELSDLSILEKEENLKPHITSNLEKFSKLFL